jgi:hypothetical protein
MIHIKEFIEKYEIDDILINVFMNVALISTFIVIFFFTYASDVEKNIIQEQSRLITTDLVTTIKPFLSIEECNSIKTNLAPPDMTYEDDLNTKYNNALKNSAYNNVIFIFGICITVSFALAMIFIKPTHNYVLILLVNFVLLIVVGLTEFTFLNFIISSYIIGDPSYVRYKIITSIRDKLILPDIVHTPSVM